MINTEDMPHEVILDGGRNSAPRMVGITPVSDRRVEISPVSKEQQREHAKMLASQLNPGDSLPSVLIADAKRAATVTGHIEGDRAIVHFSDNPLISVGSHREGNEPRATLSIGAKPYGESDPRFVAEVAGVDQVGMGLVVDSVTEQLDHWQNLDPDTKIAVTQDVSGIFDAARIRAGTGDFEPADADRIFDLYTAHMDAISGRAHVLES